MNAFDQQLGALRDSIRTAFPAGIFEGQVTPFDGAFIEPNDEEELLFKALKGRKWTDLEPELLTSLVDGYVFLTDEAYRAFLPAWLTFALGNLDGENEVRSFILYSFGRTAQRLRALRREQRAVVRTVVAYFGEREQNDFLKEHATQALEYMEKLERDLVTFPWLDRSGEQR